MDVDNFSNGSTLLNNVMSCPYIVKTLKIFLSSTKNASRLNLGIQHRGLKVYKDGMTFDLFMVWSNLCPSCCCNTGRMLYGIFKYAIAFVLSGERIVALGPLVYMLAPVLYSDGLPFVLVRFTQKKKKKKKKKKKDLHPSNTEAPNLHRLILI